MANTSSVKVPEGMRGYHLIGMRLTHPVGKTRDENPQRFATVKGVKVFTISADGTEKLGGGPIFNLECCTNLAWSEKGPKPTGRTEECKASKPCALHAIIDGKGAKIDLRNGLLIIPTEKRGRTADAGLSADALDSLFASLRDEESSESASDSDEENPEDESDDSDEESEESDEDEPEPTPTPRRGRKAN